MCGVGSSDMTGLSPGGGAERSDDGDGLPKRE